MDEIVNAVFNVPLAKAAIFFHPSVCHWCKGRENLKMCVSCKSISYCCKLHQREDWISHKNVCKLISQTDKLIPVTHQNQWEMELCKRGFEERTHYYHSVMTFWKKKLKRNLYKYEVEILMFRKSCIICNSRNASISCQNCSSVFYCSSDHQSIHNEKHNMFCESLKLCFDAMLYNWNNFFKIHIPSLSKKCITLKAFPENLENLIEILIQESYIGLPNNFFEKLRVTDMFAPIAIILYGLERANLLKNNSFMKNDLIVHIIGANHEEQNWNWHLLIEFVFHWIKNMRMLTFVAVGPDAGTWDLTNLGVLHSTFGSCRMRSSHIKCYSSPNYYHDVVDELEKPDIVVAFNSGIFAVPTWEKSIPSLLKYPGVPLILTDYTLSYTQQDVDIVKEISKQDIENIVIPQRNPFSCITPQRHDHKSFPIFYNNGYIAILKSK